MRSSPVPCFQKDADQRLAVEPDLEAQRIARRSRQGICRGCDLDPLLRMHGKGVVRFFADAQQELCASPEALAPRFDGRALGFASRDDGVQAFFVQLCMELQLDAGLHASRGHLLAKVIDAQRGAQAYRSGMRAVNPIWPPSKYSPMCRVTVAEPLVAGATGCATSQNSCADADNGIQPRMTGAHRLFIERFSTDSPVIPL